MEREGSIVSADPNVLNQTSAEYEQLGYPCGPLVTLVGGEKSSKQESKEKLNTVSRENKKKETEDSP